MKTTYNSAAVIAALAIALLPPAYAGGGRLVNLSVQSQKIAGIRTAKARSGPLADKLSATGRIIQDAQNVFHLKAGADGTLSGPGASLGRAVKKGQTLTTVAAASGDIAVVSPAEGVVTGVSAEAGSAVRAGDILLTVTGVDPVWAVLDMPEKDLARLSVGQPALIGTSAYGGKVFNGETVFVSPEIDEISRTIKTRVRISNPGGLLKFGMFITAELPVREGGPSVFVPRDALQRVPEGWIVFVRKNAGTFEARTVKPGRETPAETEILEGLRPGESVATDGAFMLKSEMMKDQLGEGE